MAVLTAGGTSMVCGCESADCRKRFRRRAGPDRDPRDGRGRHGERHRRCPRLPARPRRHSRRPGPHLAERALLRPMRDAGEFQAEAQYRPLDRTGGICQEPGPMLPVPGCKARGGLRYRPHRALRPRRADSPVQPTWLCSAVFIISSKPSCAAKRLGKSNSRMAPSSGPPSAAPTPPRRAARCSFRNWPSPADPSPQPRARVSPRAHPDDADPKTPRAAERAPRIRWERGLNEARMNADPPPFLA